MRTIHFRLLSHARAGMLGLTVGLVASAAPAMGEPIAGVVRTVRAAGMSPSAIVVYAEPLDSAPPRRPGTVTLTQRDKTFLPGVLAVPVGSTVSFPNEDSIFHNVFSLSTPQPFDLGLYRSGESKTRTFTEPGVYRVFCNIHPQMTALIVVAPTPYIAVADADGRFSLDVPAGRYRVTALSGRASPASLEAATVAAGRALELELDESRWVATQHRNKFGQPYPAAAYKR